MTDQGDYLGFIVVRLGERSYADAGVALFDVSEAIDSVPGCSTESFGAFPAAERELLSAYVEATRPNSDASDESGASTDA